MTGPRIYVACLASYNAGTLYGKWIHASQGEAGIHEDVQFMLRESHYPDAEEYAIHDYEGFGSFEVKEYSSISEIAKIAELIEKHGELISDYYTLSGCRLNELEEKFEMAYQGKFESLEDYANEYLENTGTLEEIPQFLRYYFDFESFARDMELNGDVISVKKSYKEVHVFDAHV